MFKVDMWYGDRITDADKIDVFFSDADCLYRGDIYKNGKRIGDYVCDDSVQIEREFPNLKINWD